MHTQTSPSIPAGPARRLSVLIADDEPLILRALTRFLERRGHEVFPVPDAHQALALLAERSFDAVVVDANMPGTGWSVLLHLEESAFGGPVVLMTGGVAPDAIGVNDGVRRLQKPFPFPSVIPLVEGTALN